MLTDKKLKRAIVASLSVELLDKKYRAFLKPSDASVRGHCAVASEAFYHLMGGKEAGLMPAVCGYEVDEKGCLHFNSAAASDFRHETHWWIQGPKNGKRGAGTVIDLTAAQFDFPFPYEKGRHVGFMQPRQKPSKRAQVVIDRVTALLGAKALSAYREQSIQDFYASNVISSRARGHSSRLLGK